MFLNDLEMAWEDEILEGKKYENETVTGIDFDKMEFERVEFSKCRFIGCDFTASSFKQVVFKDCDISNCRFQNCYIKDVTMLECKGDGSNFSQSSFVQSNLVKGSYHYANFGYTLWENCKIEEGDFCDSFFSEVKFKKTRMDNVDLSRSDFFKTPLRGMDLSDCCIDGLSVSDTYKELQGLKISPVQAMVLVKLLGVKIK